MHRIVEVENMRTFARSVVVNPKLRKGDIFQANGDYWKVTRVYSRMEGSF